MLTKKELKRFKALLSKPEEDLTDAEVEELDSLEDKMNKREEQEEPSWVKKLLEKLDQKPLETGGNPQKVPIPPIPEPEEPEEPILEPEEPEPPKKKNGFLSWLM